MINQQFKRCSIVQMRIHRDNLKTLKQEDDFQTQRTQQTQSRVKSIVLLPPNVTSVLLQVGCTAFLTWLHSSVGWMLRCRPFVGLMHCICRSDKQHWQVGCTTFTVQITQFLQGVACITFGWSDVQFQQVGCKTFVGRMNNFCRSNAQLLQVGCTTLVGRMHNF